MADVKKGETLVTVGTRKGLFLFHSRDRRRWTSRGPSFEGDTIRHARLDPRDRKTIWTGVTSEHRGARAVVARTKDFGGKWEVGKEGPRFSKKSGLSVTRIWQVQPGLDEDLWIGVEPAGLFRSEDDGQTWGSIDALNYWPGREKWNPGAGGLCLHSILPYPRESKRMLIGISAAGIFGTNDAGASWRMLDGGIRGFAPGKMSDEDTSTCVHKMVRDTQDPSVVYMQNHRGVYRRKRGDPSWTLTEKGLPIANKKDPVSFGFPIVAHPHDAKTAYIVPLEGDFNRIVHKGAMAVFRTTDGGARWARLSKGLP